MIKYDYKSGGRKVRHIYFIEKMGLTEFEQEATSCDELSIFYAGELDDRINERYGNGLIYMSKGSDWNSTNYSLMIDITPEEKEILNGFHRNRKYKVRRARDKDGLMAEMDQHPDKIKMESLSSFYNEFAHAKGLAEFDIERYSAAAKAGCFLLATVCDSDGEKLVQNGYILDFEDKVSTFAFGASHFRSYSDKSALIGRANSFLHYKAMCHLREMGFTGFDFGGLYIGDDVSLTNISDFKRSFGGEVRTYAPKIIFQKRDYECVEHNLPLIKDAANGRKVVVWGMGNWGRYVVRQLMSVYGIKPSCLIDSVPYQNQGICGPEAIKDYSPNESFLIIVTRRKQYEEIAKNEYVLAFEESHCALCIREDWL